MAPITFQKSSIDILFSRKESHSGFAEIANRILKALWKSMKKFLKTVDNWLKDQKSIDIEVKASSIRVDGSIYPVPQISGVKIVKIKRSNMEILSRNRRHAILMKMQGESYFILVASQDEPRIKRLFFEIQGAIDSQAQGDFNYIGSVHFSDAEITNMAGNFGVGFNKGEVSIDN